MPKRGGTFGGVFEYTSLELATRLGRFGEPSHICHSFPADGLSARQAVMNSGPESCTGIGVGEYGDN